MSIGTIQHWAELILSLALLVLFGAAPPIALAQDEDLDDFKVRFNAFWLRSSPTVTLEGESRTGFVDFNRDFNFNDYSTGGGKIDWRFTRKNHLYFVFTPFIQSNDVALNRTVTFRGQTFNVGAVTHGELRSILYAPGYQYDIIRRNRGHLGVAVQFNLFDTRGTLSAAAQVTSTGVHQAATFSEGSLRAPIPVAGPEYRLYITRSPRIFVEGNLYGMYFFGYGNFVSSTNDIGLSFSKHFGVKVGYSVGSRLRVNDSHNRIGLNLTQKGPLAGIEVSF